MKKGLFSVCTFLIIGLASASDVPRGEHVYVIENDMQSLLLEHVYFYATKSSAMTFDQIIDHDSLFQASGQKRLRIGNFNNAAWIRVHLTNQSKIEELIFEFQQPYVDSLAFLVSKNKKVIRKYPEKGLSFPENSKREYLLSNPSYRYYLSIPEGDTVSIYWRCIINKGTLEVSHELWNPSHYSKRERQVRFKTTYLLLCGGFALLVIIVAFTFYLFTKDTIQLYYIGFVFSNVGNLILMANFFSAKIFERYVTMGMNYSDFFGVLQIFFGLQYTIHFLQLKEKVPRIYGVLKAVVWIDVLNAALIWLVGQYEFIQMVNFYLITYSLLFAALASIGIAIYLVIKKDLMARYFLVAYLPLLYFVSHYFAFMMGLTDRERTLSWEVVIFFEIFVLTLAMAHRYYLIGKKNIEYQKTINQQQKSQIKYMISAQEKERKRIAKELHDGVVQEVGSVILGLRKMSKHDSNKKNETKELLRILEDSNRDLRTMSHQMMPKVLSELGVVPAIDQMIKSTLRYTSIDHTFESFNLDERPSEQIELTLYRIAQELINNLIKHSQASHVDVQLYGLDGFILMVFEDNGIEFHPDEHQGGMGMDNIKSRLEMVDGTVSFESPGAEGTLTTIRIPFRLQKLKLNNESRNRR